MNVTDQNVTEDETWLDIFFVTVWSVIMVAGILASGLIFLAAASSRTLQNMSNILLLNIVIADWLVCCLIPFQSISLLTPLHSETNSSFPTELCITLATLGSVCMWSRLGTFALLSHQRWFQHLSSGKPGDHCYGPWRTVGLSIATWMLPAVALALPNISTDYTIYFEYMNSSKSHICMLGFDGNDDTMIYETILGVVWLLTVLFSAMNYVRIYMYEEARRNQKRATLKRKGRQHVHYGYHHKDKMTFQTPDSPFEEVQEASRFESLKKKKWKKKKSPNKSGVPGTETDKDRRKGIKRKIRSAAKVNEGPTPGNNNSKRLKGNSLTRKATLIDNELRRMFSTKQSVNRSSCGLVVPTGILGRTQHDDDLTDRHVHPENDVRDDVSDHMSLPFGLENLNENNSCDTEKGAQKLKGKGFIDLIHYDDDDEGNDDLEIGHSTEIQMVESTTSANHTYVSYNQPSVPENIDEEDIPVFEDNLGEVRRQPSLTPKPKPPPVARKPSVARRLAMGLRVSARQHEIIITRAASFTTGIYLLLVLPAIVCIEETECPVDVFKFTHTAYILASSLQALVLACMHPDFRLVISCIIHRRWASIPAPTGWVAKLTRKRDKS